jgi:adenylate kinase family enzyme
VILGRGGAGKSTLAQDLSRRIGIPAAELDTLFWRPGPNGPIPAEPAAWTAQQRELVQSSAWIIDGDLGPYDRDLGLRLHAADTVIVLDFGFLRCAWRTLRRGREQAEYWRWVWSYRRSLPAIEQAIAAGAPHAAVYILRTPAMVRRFLSEASAAESAQAGGDQGG